MVEFIKLSNLFSIDEEVTLDLRAAPSRSNAMRRLVGNTFERGGQQVLKSVGIFGANAAGKSNVLNAIRACVDIILHSHANNDGDRLRFAPFKFGGGGRPSSFLIRFETGGTAYEYGFTMTTEGVETEALSLVSTRGRRVSVFERDERRGKGAAAYKFGAGITRPADVAESTPGNCLFLSRASQMNRDAVKPVYRFFRDAFVLDYYKTPYAEFVSDRLERYKGWMLDAMAAADMDIVDVRWRTEAGRLVLTTYHRNDPSVPFDYHTEESGGTRTLFNMMLSLVSLADSDGKFVLVDEIEAGLHYRLVEHVIKMFHRSASSQLVFTSHDLMLLDADVLRRDQVCFANKLPSGATELYSLFDFNGFKDGMDMRKYYLQGRFAAVPYVREEEYGA